MSGPRFVVKALDRYFGTQVSQDIKRRVAACFGALDQEGSIAGYYTLGSASVSLADLPAPLMKRLPRYPSVSAVRMGRLAVARSCQGNWPGAALLLDVLRGAVAAEIAAHALLVDAKDESAARFYRHHGFIASPTQPRLFFLPLAGVKALTA